MSYLSKLPCESGIIEGHARRIHSASVEPAETPVSGKWVLAATILGSSTVFIDGSVVNVALPAIQDDLARHCAERWDVDNRPRSPGGRRGAADTGAVSRAASLLAVAVFGVVVVVAFENGLDDRIADLWLAPEAQAAIDTEKVRLAAAEPPPGLDAATSAAVADAYDRSFLASFRLAMIVAAVMSVLSAVSSWLLVAGKGPEPLSDSAGVS